MTDSLLAEEAECRKKLAKMDEDMKAAYRQMDHLRDDERSRRTDPIQRKIEGLEREERQRLLEMSDLTSRREALRRQTSNLNSQKVRLEISVRSMEQKAVADPRILYQQRSDLRSLEKELQDFYNEERKIKAALDDKEESLTALGRMLQVARAELSDAAVASVGSSDLMRQLVAAQRDRIQAWTGLNEELFKVTYKISVANVRQQQCHKLSQLDHYVS